MFMETKRSIGRIHTLSREEGKHIWFLGTLVTIKATAENTEGGMSLIEQVAPPGFAPPLHVHHKEDEPFYVLEGRVTFYPGEQVVRATPGTFVLLPKDVPHTFQVEEPDPARLLQITYPAGLEEFFEEVGEPAPSPTLPPPSVPDIEKLAEKLAALSAKYDVEILGPPPGP
jgi:mannose-6-phosphate isomerase-like protein (cupin superfamily)